MAQRFGLTWWGQRWIAALEQLGTRWSNRLPRGRTYARKGTVHDLEIAPGRVTALVEGSRPRPYRVTLTLTAFDDDTWDAIVAALAAELRHAAALLDGRMPEDVDDTLAEVGVSLFPTAADLRTACSCPDSANPCKHIAAVHYVLATRFDDDPFLLPQLRGRGRDDLLAALRAQRAGTSTVAADEQVVADSVTLDDVRPRDLFDVEEAVEVDLTPERGDTLAVLRRLGPLPAPFRHAQDDVEDAVSATADAAWLLLTGSVDDLAS